MTYVDLNGDIVQLEQATVPALDVSCLYGIGLFETMRAIDGRVLEYAAHRQRMLASAETLNLPLSEAMLPAEDRLLALLQHNEIEDARIRVTFTGGAAQPDGVHHSVLSTVAPFQPYAPEHYEQGITVLVSRAIQQQGLPYCGHKALCYWPRLHVLQDAQAKGCVEALWFNEQKQLACGCISNVFVVKDDHLRTPPLHTPVLPGVSRAAVMRIAASQGIECQEQPLTIDDLLDADEVFLTNTMMQVLPVCQVERKAIAAGSPGEMTRRLIEAYQRAVLTNDTEP